MDLNFSVGTGNVKEKTGDIGSIEDKIQELMEKHIWRCMENSTTKLCLTC